MSPTRDHYWRDCHIKRVLSPTVLEMLIDLGYGMTFTHPVALLHLRPTASTPADRKAAVAWTGEWLDSHAPCGPAFSVESERTADGRYEVIVMCHAGHTLNADLVRSGHAVPEVPR